MAEQLLVGILKKTDALSILFSKKWYHIPVDSVERLLADRWPPQWMAFYQTGDFGPDKYQIRYYGKVRRIRRAKRKTLFPREVRTPDKWYYQIFLEEVLRREPPLVSRKPRRNPFIKTTHDKFMNAIEFNDLFDDSPLEDELWSELKKRKIPAERQDIVQGREGIYYLDFAVYCEKGDLDIETDGDTFHTRKNQVTKDNIRDNDLETIGWKILRFNTSQIREEMRVYCLPKIVTNINNLGGPSEGRVIPRKLSSDGTPFLQDSLFDPTEDD